MSSAEQTTNPDDPRPPRLTAAAALAALEGLALIVLGVYMVVVGLVDESTAARSAVTGGLTMLALAVIPLIAARGLLNRRSWSRGPAIVIQLLALPVAWQLLQVDSVLIPGGIVLAVVAVTTLVLLLSPATTRALGIGPRGADADAA
ncbi:hypothetical protein [Streptomyces apocyni]|uniref:hypothetical protein n=1 Tax=Streptomyces apocyni TaxID=2654677 RepID=UPI0012EA1A05|nr:hypothetical protein [Streptomyces apocyni]